MEGVGCGMVCVQGPLSVALEQSLPSPGFQSTVTGL